MQTVNPEPLDPGLLTLYTTPSIWAFFAKPARAKCGSKCSPAALGTQDTPLSRDLRMVLARMRGNPSRRHGDPERARAGGVQPAWRLSPRHAANAEGFCYLNDIVIAILDALRVHPGIKIAYVDFDAHHGNGVQEAFYENPGVLFISAHETGRTLYPGPEARRKSGKARALDTPSTFPWNRAQMTRFTPISWIARCFRSSKPLLRTSLLSKSGGHADLRSSHPPEAHQQRVPESPSGDHALCRKILALGGGGYDLYRTSRCWTLAWSILNHVEPVDELCRAGGRDDVRP